MKLILEKWNDVKDRDEVSMPDNYGLLRKEQLRIQTALLKDRAELAHIFMGLNNMDTDLLHLVSADAWIAICKMCHENPLAGKFRKFFCQLISSLC